LNCGGGGVTCSSKALSSVWIFFRVCDDVVSLMTVQQKIREKWRGPASTLEDTANRRDTLVKKKKKKDDEVRNEHDTKSTLSYFFSRIKVKSIRM
jgi:hypothetical protein